jgi:hypothetical protein
MFLNTPAISQTLTGHFRALLAVRKDKFLRLIGSELDFGSFSSRQTGRFDDLAADEAADRAARMLE